MNSFFCCHQCKKEGSPDNRLVYADGVWHCPGQCVDKSEMKSESPKRPCRRCGRDLTLIDPRNWVEEIRSLRLFFGNNGDVICPFCIEEMPEIRKKLLWPKDPRAPKAEEIKTKEEMHIWVDKQLMGEDASYVFHVASDRYYRVVTSAGTTSGNAAVVITSRRGG